MDTTDSISPDAVEGVRMIANRQPVGSLAFSGAVKAAIDAGLAYDADPTYWASDMNIGRTAALTETGRGIALAHRFIDTCACEPCLREAPTDVSAYCNFCRGQGKQQGYVGRDCYGCYLKLHPEVAAERTQRLDACKPHSRRSDRSEWNANLTYVPQGTTLVREQR